MNLLVLFRLKNQFFEFCEDMEQGSLKWSEMKSFMPGISHLLQNTDFKLIATLLRKSQNTLSVSKQASKLISKKRDIVETSSFLHLIRAAL